MKVAYLYPEHLGKKPTRLLQVAATLRALARQEAQVSFLVGRFVGLGTRLEELELAAQAGLMIEPVAMWQPGPGLPLVFSWHQPYHMSVLRRLRRLSCQGFGWVMVRHLKLADFLAPRLPGLGLKMLFEVHELFSQTAREEGADPGRVVALAAQEARVFWGAQALAAISRPWPRPWRLCPWWGGR
ncbi:hypothetical protein DFAR_3610020 [Desulfarculales bacterium]